MKLIIIAGMPSAGKTTISSKISKAFCMPVLEKDNIKEELFDTIGYADLEEKRQLDIISTAILLRCAEDILKSGNSLIIVNNFRKDSSEIVQNMIDRTGCLCVNVFLGGDADVFYKRYVERDKKKLRHQGHTFIDRYPPLAGDDVNKSMTRMDFANIFEKQGMAEFKINAPRIDVDATYPDNIDTEELIIKIRQAFGGECE